jgi:hypothetical protein
MPLSLAKRQVAIHDRLVKICKISVLPQEKKEAAQGSHRAIVPRHSAEFSITLEIHL